MEHGLEGVEADEEKGVEADEEKGGASREGMKDREGGGGGKGRRGKKEG